jgi:hypothetical protein
MVWVAVSAVLVGVGDVDCCQLLVALVVACHCCSTVFALQTTHFYVPTLVRIVVSGTGVRHRGDVAFSPPFSTVLGNCWKSCFCFVAV